MTRTIPELRLARRMSRLGTETAFEVLGKARALERQGRNIVHLEIGEPDFDTPPNIVEAGVEALHKGWTHYGPSAGLPELRQAIADEVSRSRKIPVSPDEVVIVPGGKPIIFFLILALIEEQDEIIDYFKSCETSSLQIAQEELSDHNFNWEQLKIMRIKFLSEYGM